MITTLRERERERERERIHTCFSIPVSLHIVVHPLSNEGCPLGTSQDHTLVTDIFRTVEMILQHTYNIEKWK